MKILILCIVSLIIIGCNGTTTPGFDTVIRGSIRGPEGEALSNVKILINYNIEPELPYLENNLLIMSKKISDNNPKSDPPVDYGLKPNYPNPFNGYTSLRFTLAESGVGSLWIENNSDRIIIKLFKNQSLMPNGTYTYLWHGRDSTGKKVSNDLYTAVVKTEHEEYRRTMFLLRDYNNIYYNQINTSVITNEAGCFLIYNQEFPINSTGLAYDELGYPWGEFTVTPFIDIWAFHEDYGSIHEDNILLEPGKEIHVSLRFY